MEEPEHREFIQTLRSRYHAEGSVFWLTEGELGVFDADLARQVHSHNMADRPLGDRLSDVLRRRDSTRMTWDQVRAAWLGQVRALSGAATTAALDERMRAVLDARLDRDVDLVWLAHEMITRATVPLIISGLSPRAGSVIHADLIGKIRHLLVTAEPGHLDNSPLPTPALTQMRAGFAVRREIRGRARGSRPSRLDLTEPIVRDLLPDLGMDRAVDAVTSMLTAIAGPPGSAAASVIYELHRQSDWARLLRKEHLELSDEEFHASPTRSAPTTHRFVKEVLRLWSPPVMLARVTHRETEVGEHVLHPGQLYLLSAFLIHHDPKHWPDPEAFDPDRWLPEASPSPRERPPYIPFGWAPTSCIGASLGTTQLMLLCRLLTTRYAVAPEAGGEPRMMVAAVPTPIRFRGRITQV